MAGLLPPAQAADARALGKNDAIFVSAGAAPYQRDLPNAQVHLFDTGHFALETHGEEIANLMRDFLARHLK